MSGPIPPATLIALADEIDERLGPIPGPRADHIAKVLRSCAGAVEALEKLIYVPGLWRCAKCGLSLITTTLDASSGRFAANREPQSCANGCGPMWRVAERDAGNKLIDDMEQMQARHDRRVSELLAANNAEVERRRMAESALRLAADRFDDLATAVEAGQPYTNAGFLRASGRRCRTAADDRGWDADDKLLTPHPEAPIMVPEDGEP